LYVYIPGAGKVGGSRVTAKATDDIASTSAAASTAVSAAAKVRVRIATLLVAGL
jgi:hypothetical protein